MTNKETGYTLIELLAAIVVINIIIIIAGCCFAFCG